MEGLFSTLRRTSTNLVAMVGCHGDMVTMATVSGSFFILLKELRLNFLNFFLGINFSVRLLKVLLKSVTVATWKIPATPLFYSIISLNLAHGFNVYH